MNNQVRAFTNTTEFMMWQEANCCQCKKNYTCDEDGKNGVTLCDIEESISLSAAYAGNIEYDVAVRAGLHGLTHGYGRTCSEIKEI